MSFQNPLVRWTFRLFTLLLVLINGALTFSFGRAYLGAAFGGGFIADWLGAFYALLIFDVAYLTWFWVFLRNAESTGQRAVSGLMAAVALLGSIMATINQLAVNSFQLVDLSGYHDAVGFVALVTMLIVTAAHIIASAGYILLNPEERVRQSMVNINAKALDDSLKEAERRIIHDMDAVIDIMARESRRGVLTQLGFTENLERIGEGERPLLTSRGAGHGEGDDPKASQPKTTGAGDGRHSPLSERRARIDNDPTNDPPVYSQPYPNVTIFDAPDNAENFTNGNGRSM